MSKRFETDFGDDGMAPGAKPRQGTMEAFGARYRFDGRTWAITVWAVDWADAEEYARRHRLTIDGKIVSVSAA